MASKARANGSELRQATRHPIDVRAMGEHRQRGDILLHLVNISTTGFMISGRTELGRGERVTVRLPAIGRIEAFLAWTSGERAGFQFERVLRPEDLRMLLDHARRAPQLRFAR